MTTSLFKGRPTPYLEFDRRAWQDLASTTPLPLTNLDLSRLRALGDPIDLAEADLIYRPLARLLALHYRAARNRQLATSKFLGKSPRKVPFIIGLAGSVAAGKSTVSRLLRELMSRWPETPRVQLVTTDGFLYSNRELHRRGIMDRKGFPESFDQGALLRFVASIKAGVEQVDAPVYSHLTYDIVPGVVNTVSQPDVLILEGLNVLQPARLSHRGGASVAVSDYFDFSIYVDAALPNLRTWYVERFLKLRETAFTNPDSYFRKYSLLDDAEARQTATHIWKSINEPNLVQNIRPTRGRATLILHKGEGHRMDRMFLRKG